MPCVSGRFDKSCEGEEDAERIDMEEGAVSKMLGVMSYRQEVISR